MPVPRAWIWLVVSALLALLPTSNLCAQEAADEAPVPIPTLDIQRFTPVGSYHNFLTVHDGQLLPKMKFGFDVVFNYEGQTLKSVSMKTVKPFSVDLDEFDVRPREAFGKLAQKTLAMLAPKVARDARVTLDFSVTPKK